MLTNASERRLHAGEDLVIREVACREPGWLWGGQTPRLVLIQRGALVVQTCDSPAERPRDDAVHIADPCTALIVRDRTLHRIHPPCEDGADGLVIELGAELAADRLRGLCQDRDVGVALSPRLQIAVTRFAAMRQRRTAPGVAQAAIELLDEIGEAARSPVSCRMTQGKRRPATARRLAIATIAQIHRDLSVNRSISDLADDVGCSPFHLMHAFRAEVGDTVRAYRLRARLGSALHRLAQGQVDLSALATELGFASHSHLTDTFARELGVSPSRLRAQLHEPDRLRARSARAGA